MTFRFGSFSPGLVSTPTTGFIGTSRLGDQAPSLGNWRKMPRNRAKCDGAPSSAVGFASPCVATAFSAASESVRFVTGRRITSGVPGIEPPVVLPRAPAW